MTNKLPDHDLLTRIRDPVNKRLTQHYQHKILGGLIKSASTLSRKILVDFTSQCMTSFIDECIYASPRTTPIIIKSRLSQESGLPTSSAM